MYIAKSSHSTSSKGISKDVTRLYKRETESTRDFQSKKKEGKFCEERNFRTRGNVNHMRMNSRGREENDGTFFEFTASLNDRAQECIFASPFCPLSSFFFPYIEYNFAISRRLPSPACFLAIFRLCEYFIRTRRREIRGASAGWTVLRFGVLPSRDT